jgi:hypothetical protein
MSAGSCAKPRVVRLRSERVIRWSVRRRSWIARATLRPRFIHVEGLRDDVEGAQSDGIAGQVWRRVRRDDHHWQVRIVTPDPAEDVDARQPRHREVEE